MMLLFYSLRQPYPKINHFSILQCTYRKYTFAWQINSLIQQLQTAFIHIQEQQALQDNINIYRYVSPSGYQAYIQFRYTKPQDYVSPSIVCINDLHIHRLLGWLFKWTVTVLKASGAMQTFGLFMVFDHMLKFLAGAYSYLLTMALSPMPVSGHMPFTVCLSL